MRRVEGAVVSVWVGEKLQEEPSEKFSFSVLVHPVSSSAP